ncbi:DUF1638 domain-containing protein [uncultured Bilophila sp.]|uniref:DUF1638 domain-containing protein n=1 Tax=uncultured Bilophila sp. TaxID=529385 RepID=UPI0026DD318E|nr:DUF1638 domain-containing protein [uncultured Bilophila sp.]
MHLIACEVFRPELERLLDAGNGACDVTYLEQGLHETPDSLRRKVQETVDGLEAQGAERILLAYGLCGRGLAGVTPRTSVLILPRTHDCIPVLLGTSQARANECTLGGSTYWLSPGWLNYPQTLFFRKREERYRDYEARFGAEAAAYLIETEASWLKNYTNVCLIRWPGWENDAELLETSEAVARDAGLPFRVLPGKPDMLQALLEGGEDSRFLHVRPGYTIDLDGNGAIAAVRVSS